MMSLDNHIKRLAKEHRELDSRIVLMENTGRFNDEELVQLKKQRLRLKDEIERLLHLDPDHLPHKSDHAHQ
jgi:uncharacterized protein YdcH (DUF465 family)